MQNNKQMLISSIHVCKFISCSKEPNDAHTPQYMCPRDNMMPLCDVGNNSKLT